MAEIPILHGKDARRFAEKITRNQREPAPREEGRGHGELPEGEDWGEVKSPPSHGYPAHGSEVLRLTDVTRSEHGVPEVKERFPLNAVAVDGASGRFPYYMGASGRFS
jgi:hypothetical protein